MYHQYRRRNRTMDSDELPGGVKKIVAIISLCSILLMGVESGQPFPSEVFRLSCKNKQYLIRYHICNKGTRCRACSSGFSEKHRTEQSFQNLCAQSRDRYIAHLMTPAIESNMCPRQPSTVQISGQHRNLMQIPSSIIGMYAVGETYENN